MRTFSCFLFSDRSVVPDFLLILAADEQRAQVLARREWRSAKARAVELCEGGRLLWTETAQGV
jgi:hypothetical protein